MFAKQVHVNRTSFGADEEQQDSCIARVLYFFERHWAELLKFSRRTEAQLQQWAARYGYKDQPREILEHAKKGYGGGRYSCVNLQNRDTVEFRMFLADFLHEPFNDRRISEMGAFQFLGSDIDAIQAAQVLFAKLHTPLYIVLNSIK